MCGIAGLWSVSGEYDAAKIAAHMNAQLIHRGPDDDGVWVDAAAGIALAQRRLAILDLSPEGHQPMHSRDGRHVLVFNGEIYNHLELRTTLGNIQWRGHSDTEVLLEAISRWGLEEALKRSVGMFALALWDKHERILSLARDRLGEKPLYYGWVGKTLVFASELKALRVHPAWHGEVDRTALTLYLRHGDVPAPLSIYRGIHKLPPATLARFSGADCQTVPTTYWSATEAARRGQSHPLQLTDGEATSALERVLLQSVAGQSVADVPLGAFLSGGIDSSLIVALMQKVSTRPVKTFTIGFHSFGYDEAPHAAAVAHHLGTEHTQLYVTPEEARAVIQQLPHVYDEPFADSSQIPTLLVAALARRQVTVALSGDGGDELFGGYTRYCWGPRILHHGWSQRQVLAALLNLLSPGSWDKLFRCVPGARTLSAPGDKLQKLAALLRCNSRHRLYQQLVSLWPQPTSVVIGGNEPVSGQDWPERESFAEQMMLRDALEYLPDDILTKVDRASMSVSLETRAPFLDHRVFEFAWQLPMAQKIREQESKWLLRRLLYQYVPRDLIERPKAGFSVPIGEWLRGPLRDWADALLDEARLRRDDYFDPGPIRQAWHEHLRGTRNWQHRLWAILMFQTWLENQAT